MELKLTDKVQDTIIRGITRDKYIRFFGVNCLNTLKEATAIHNFSITNRVVFGRLLAAAAIMAADFKSDNQAVTLKLDSNGVAGGTIITARRSDKSINLKGFMPDPGVETELKKGLFDVQTALGEGFLQIIKDLGLKNSYVGNVELIYKEIAEDITYYYVKSEQIPTSLGLGVLIFPEGEIKQAGGFMVQLMPDTPEEIISKLEDNIRKFPNLTDMLDIGHSIENLIKNYLLKGFQTEITETLDTSYKCECSREKMLKGLKLVDKKEIESVLAEFGEVRTSCHFCNSEYSFQKEDLFE